MSGGFVRPGDYVLCFRVAEPSARENLVLRCDGEWQGDERMEGLWEISNELSPQELEDALLTYLAPGDRAVFYYLSDTRRVFRVELAP